MYVKFEFRSWHVKEVMMFAHAATAIGYELGKLLWGLKRKVYSILHCSNFVHYEGLGIERNIFKYYTINALLNTQ